MRGERRERERDERERERQTERYSMVLILDGNNLHRHE